MAGRRGRASAGGGWGAHGGPGEPSRREGASRWESGGRPVWARSEEEAEPSTSPRAAPPRGTGALVCGVDGGGLWGDGTVVRVTGCEEEAGETGTTAECHVTAFSTRVLPAGAPLGNRESDVIFPHSGLDAGVEVQEAHSGSTLCHLPPRTPFSVTVVPVRRRGHARGPSSTHSVQDTALGREGRMAGTPVRATAVCVCVCVAGSPSGSFASPGSG